LGEHRLVVRHEGVDDEPVGQVVHEAHPERVDYHFEEEVVVFLPDAVVQVHAVVVEPRRTPVASPAVLGAGQHVGLADLTVVLVQVAVEVDAPRSAVLLQLDGRISRIAERSQVPVDEYYYSKAAVDEPQGGDPEGAVAERGHVNNVVSDQVSEVDEVR